MCEYGRVLANKHNLIFHKVILMEAVYASTVIHTARYSSSNYIFN